jgi:hypothetical protein
LFIYAIDFSINESDELIVLNYVFRTAADKRPDWGVDNKAELSKLDDSITKMANTLI